VEPPVVTPGLGGRLLAGLRIIEVSSFVAVPSAGLALAQLGADVVRVDPVGGGPDIKRWPVNSNGRSLYWAGLNRGKRSVALDLRSSKGQETLHQLIEGSGPDGGIVISNLVGRAWLADSTLRARRSDLINVQVLGRRDGGTAVDYTVNAATGLPFATGVPQQGPVNHALPAWDLLCGMYVALSVLAAAQRRSRTGVGTFASVSLQDVAESTLTTLGFVPEAQITGQSREACGNSVYGTYGVDMLLADNHRVMIVALTRRQWTDLVAVTNQTKAFDLLAQRLEVDFSDEGTRFEHRELLDELLRPWFAARTIDEVAEALSGTSVLWSPFRKLTDLAEDLVAGSALPTIALHDDDGLGSVLATAGPIRLIGEPDPPIGSAPVLGEQTNAVLERLGATTGDTS
jgi:2-methylfumaryl-CoA isomerase